MMNQNDKCEATFLKGLELEPANLDLLYALFAFHMKQNNKAKAGVYIEKMNALYPGNKDVQRLYQEFKNN